MARYTLIEMRPTAWRVFGPLNLFLGTARSEEGARALVKIHVGVKISLRQQRKGV